MLSDVIQVVKFLREGYSALAQLHQEQRKQLASLCEGISDVFTKVLATPADRRQEISLCGELKVYVERIHQVGSGTLASEGIDDLANKLDTLCETMRALRGKGEPSTHSYEGYLDQIAQGAGEFRGLARRLGL